MKMVLSPEEPVAPTNFDLVSESGSTMHIALVRRQCSLRKAGAERYCVNLFRGLQKLGHKVTVIGEGIDDELRRSRFPARPGEPAHFLEQKSFIRRTVRKTRSFAFV